jgi:hypothetical protein
MNTYAKLRDGSWGVRVQGAAASGDVVVVTKRDGTSKTETIGRVVWTCRASARPTASDGAPEFTLCSIAAPAIIDRRDPHFEPSPRRAALRRAAERDARAADLAAAERADARDSNFGATRAAFEVSSPPVDAPPSKPRGFDGEFDM